MNKNCLYKTGLNIFLSTLLLFVFRLPALAWFGTILDKETNEPIEGAIIVRSWEKTHGIPGLTNVRLEALKEVFSDRKGRFNIFGRLPALNTRENKPVIFKSGYRFIVVNDKASTIKLEKTPASYYSRYEEVEKARDYAQFYIYKTKYFNKILNDEVEFIKRINKYVPGVWLTGFVSPNDIAIDHEDNIFVSDKYLKQISKYSQKGDKVSISRGSSSGSVDIEIDQNGNLYMLDGGKLTHSLFVTRPHQEGSFSPGTAKHIKKRTYYGQVQYGYNSLASESSTHIEKNSDIDIKLYGDIRFAYVKNKGIYAIRLKSEYLFSFDFDGNQICKRKIPNKNCTPFKRGIELIDIDSAPDGSIVVAASCPKPYRDRHRKRYVFNNGIFIFGQDCYEASFKQINIDSKVRSIQATGSGFVVADKDNIYIYDKNINLISKQEIAHKELGHVDIHRVLTDESGSYLYIVDRGYNRILKYNLKTREYCLR